MRHTSRVLALALAVAAPAAGGLAAHATVGAQTTSAHSAGATLRWHPANVDSKQELRGLAPVSATTAWISGDEGGVWRTVDGGAHWRDVAPPKSKKLLFRDVEATDENNALLLAIGPKTKSRIYRTTDGGVSWTKTFVNHDPDAFFDCMSMWPGGKAGLAMSDPVNGKFRVIRTTDSGRSWHLVNPAGMPAAADGEFGFAASGTCLVTAGHQRAWIASGGAASRVFRTSDRGKTWRVTDSTLPAADAGGTFGLTFKGPKHGLAVGGDYTVPANGADYSAHTGDGGRTWHNGGDLGGYRSGVDWVPGAHAMAIAVGTSGSDVTYDGGRSWATFGGGYDSVQCVHGGVCWASGARGHVARALDLTD